MGVLSGQSHFNVNGGTAIMILRCPRTTVGLDAEGWNWGGRRFPYPQHCKERTVYHWTVRGHSKALCY